MIVLMIGAVFMAAGTLFGEIVITGPTPRNKLVYKFLGLAMIGAGLMFIGAIIRASTAA